MNKQFSSHSSDGRSGLRRSGEQSQARTLVTTPLLCKVQRKHAATLERGVKGRKDFCLKTKQADHTLRYFISNPRGGSGHSHGNMRRRKGGGGAVSEKGFSGVLQVKCETSGLLQGSRLKSAVRLYVCRCSNHLCQCKSWENQITSESTRKLFLAQNWHMTLFPPTQMKVNS